MTIGIILAAGKGSRFGSKSKLFVELCGQYVLDYPINLCKELRIEEINLVVKDREEDLDKCNIEGCNIILQSDKKGTGGATLSAVEKFQKPINGNVVILLGDCPLVLENTISQALNKLDNYDLIIGGVKSDSDHSYGRIISKNGTILSIEESSVKSEITEFRNAGWMVCNGKYLNDLLRKIPLINGEYYLTECVRIANEFDLRVGMIEVSEDIGINTKLDYINASSVLQKRFRENAINKGVLMMDPDAVYFSAKTTFEDDVQIDPYVTFKGNVKLQSGSHIKSFSSIESSTIGQNAKIGPFANLRNGTIVGEKVEIGSFVETKKSVFKKQSKAKHLSYIGDADIGEGSNISAGVVFCNYDGVNKNKSKVGKNVFLGANSSYIAPLELGDNSQIGAGSVITKNVKDNSLAVARSKQNEYKIINKNRSKD
ncbi:NTP transferase domain-containing protein [Candidatus Cytomitobacter indipagum]|nr:NTP transferase domain-containing protein [Candidatus Cytomitobacter indipagum]